MVGLAAGLCISAAGFLQAASLEAGFVVQDITPPQGWRMSGYFHERINTGTHDPLQAKVVVLRQEDVTAALVFCDLIGISRAVADQVRWRASSRSGIPEEHILVAATHTHTGPLYFGVLRDQFHEAAVREHGRDPVEWIDYEELLVERLADSIVRAERNTRPVRLEVASPRNHRVSFNRRYVMADRSVVFNPGKMNSNIVHAAGPLDPELETVAFLTPDRRKTLATFSTFALHLDTVGGTEYSADFPHYLEESLRRAFGPEFIAIFGAGPCGDINHIDVSNRIPQKGHAEARRIGRSLAQSIIDSFTKFHPVESPQLRVRHEIVRVGLQSYTDAELAWARETVGRVGEPGMPFLEKVRACAILDLAKRGGGPALLLVQVFQLGTDTAVVALPGEVFVELGLAIKDQSPFPHTLVVELANDAIAYVPTRRAFKEGSYEVVNSRIEPGGGEKLVDAALRLLRSLR